MTDEESSLAARVRQDVANRADTELVSLSDTEFNQVSVVLRDTNDGTETTYLVKLEPTVDGETELNWKYLGPYHGTE